MQGGDDAHFRERIERLYAALGSDAAVAEALGVTRETACRWRRGARGPKSRQTLRLLALAEAQYADRLAADTSAQVAEDSAAYGRSPAQPAPTHCPAEQVDPDDRLAAALRAARARAGKPQDRPDVR